MQETIEQIKTKITKYFEEDQKIRKNPDSSLDEIREYEDEFTQYLKKVVKEHGWLTISKFGKDVSYQAGILITHTQDKEFAQGCLKLIEKNIDDVDKHNFAIMHDKVMISAGKLQKYGTKLKSYFKDDGQVVTEVMPLQDPENIDILRKQLGLVPLKEYMENSEKLFLQVSGVNK